MLSRSHACVCLIILCVLSAVATAQDHKAGDIEITKRDYLTWGKKTGTYEIGTFYVPENRSEPDSRVIGIGFSRFKARNPKDDRVPVFFLPGGPGNTYLEAEGDDPQLRRTPFFIHAFTEDCDAVFVDQRGWSARGERLMGVFVGRTPKPDSGVQFRSEDNKRAAERIVKKFREQKEDLRGYTVLEMVEDVNELRQKLGYEKISLRGQSYGSQWSFAIMRQHPEIVERALLTGVEPLDHAYDMPTGLLNAAKRVWKHIDADPRFAKYLPAGGMEEVAETVIKQLEEKPIKVKKKVLFGLGYETAFIIGPEDFPWREPNELLELYHNQTKRWAKNRGQMYGRAKLLIHLVDSSMGVTPERLDKLRSDPAVRFISTGGFDPMIASADVWPTADIGDELRRPVTCEIPVVFVNGDWDMNTPIENMHEIAPFFPNSHSLTVHQAGHGTINSQLYREHPKVLGQLLTFLRTGSMEGLPTAITFTPYREFKPPRFKPSYPLRPRMAISSSANGRSIRKTNTAAGCGSLRTTKGNSKRRFSGELVRLGRQNEWK